MQIFISADIEGVAGIVSPEQGRAGNAEYERARRLMGAEVNAAIDGAFAGGATAVLVNDSHGDMRNLLADEIDPRADLIQGNPKPMSMFCGLTADYAGAICLGYHGRARDAGVLAHTFNGFAFGRVSLNGRELGEAGMYGAYAGSLGVPVICLTGDDCLERETRVLFPDAEYAVVKQALGFRAARSMAPERARSEIRARVSAAVGKARTIRPLVIEGPIRLEVELNNPLLCDQAAIMPVVQRLDAVRIAIDCDSIEHAARWVNTLSTLSLAFR